MRNFRDIAFLSIFALIANLSRAGTWPTLHKDYQRSGYTDEVVRGSYERKWYRDFHDEMIATRVEAIVAEGKCFIGTFAGQFYALDIVDGHTVWQFQTAGPIGASPCYHDGKVYFGADEGFATGNLYCLDAKDGSLLWKYDAGAGIWVSPACDGTNIYFGDRAGVFHAVDRLTGQKSWTFDTDGMILKPASFSLDGQRIVFGSEDMHVYCLSPTGGLLWKSKKLAGLSMRDQGPTIWKGLAIVRTNPADSFHTVLDRDGALLKQIQQSIPMRDEDKVLMDKWGDLVMQPTARRRAAEQDGIVDYLKECPYDQCFYAFNLADGTEPWIAPVLHTVGLHNPATPPTFNPKTGELFTFGRSAMTYYLRGVRRYNVLGRIDRATGRFDFYWPSEDNGTNWYAFPMIGDETQSLSLMGNLLVGNHQGMLAGLDLESQEAMAIWAGRDTYGGIFGPAALPGGFDRARELTRQGYLVDMPNEWHGPDRSICAVAEDRLFWVVGSQVVCLAGPDVPRGPEAGTKPPEVKKSCLPWCVAGGNVASRGAGQYDPNVEKVTLTSTMVQEYVHESSSMTVQQSDSPLATALRLRLEKQFMELLDEGPWASFVVEIGISGEERHFGRKTEVMQILCQALPHLRPTTRAKAIDYLDRLWDGGSLLHNPILSDAGKRREPYDLGPEMKRFAQREVNSRASIEDLYPVWAYAHYADRWDRIESQMDVVRGLFDDFAKREIRFKHEGVDDEAEHLNRQIAGILATVRLFEHAGRNEDATRALTMLAQLTTERVHHERADTRLIRPTKVASHKLHQAKVPRYLGWTPEVGRLLSQYTPEALEQNVGALNRGLPVWYQAYGERMIGGENYISPPHLSRGLFAALAEGCGESAQELATQLDQPWCKADLYYIEKLSYLLRKLDIEP